MNRQYFYLNGNQSTLVLIYANSLASCLNKNLKVENFKSYEDLKNALGTFEWDCAMSAKFCSVIMLAITTGMKEIFGATPHEVAGVINCMQDHFVDVAKAFAETLTQTAPEGPTRKNTNG